MRQGSDNAARRWLVSWRLLGSPKEIPLKLLLEMPANIREGAPETAQQFWSAPDEAGHYYMLYKARPIGEQTWSWFAARCGYRPGDVDSCAETYINTSIEVVKAKIRAWVEEDSR